MDLILTTPGQWIGAAGCAFVVGAAKTGIPGLEIGRASCRERVS
jgi:hypothetical protein